MQSQQKKVKWSRGETADALEERTDTGITQVSVSKMENIIADIYGNISRRPALKIISNARGVQDTPIAGESVTGDFYPVTPYTFVFTINTNKYIIFICGESTMDGFLIENEKFVRKVNISGLRDNHIRYAWGSLGTGSFAQQNNYGILAGVYPETVIMRLTETNDIVIENYQFSAPWYAPEGTQTKTVSNDDLAGLQFNADGLGFTAWAWTDDTGNSSPYSIIDTGLNGSTTAIAEAIPVGSIVKFPNLGTYMRVEGYTQGGHTIYFGDWTFDSVTTEGNISTTGWCCDATIVTAGGRTLAKAVVRAYYNGVRQGSKITVKKGRTFWVQSTASLTGYKQLTITGDAFGVFSVSWSDVTPGSLDVKMFGALLTPVADGSAKDTVVTVEYGYTSLENFMPREFVFSGQRLFATKWQNYDAYNQTITEIPGYVVGSQIAKYNDYKNDYNTQTEAVVIDISTAYQEKVNYIADYNGLKIFTTDSEYAYGQQGIVKQSTNGSSTKCRPTVFGSTLLYVDKSERQIRALQYEFQTDIYQSNVINQMCQSDMIYNPVAMVSQYDKENHTGSFLYVVQGAQQVDRATTTPAIAACNFVPGNQAEIWSRWGVPMIKDYYNQNDIYSIVNGIVVNNKPWFVVMGKRSGRNGGGGGSQSFSLAELDFDAMLDFEVTANPTDAYYAPTQNNGGFSLQGWEGTDDSIIYTKFNGDLRIPAVGDPVYNKYGAQIGTVAATDPYYFTITYHGITYEQESGYSIIHYDLTFGGATVSVFDGDQYMWDDTLGPFGEYTKPLTDLTNPRVGFMINATLESHPIDVGGKTYTDKKRIGKAVAVIRNTEPGTFTVCGRTGYTSPDKKTVSFYGCTGMKDQVRYTINNIQGAKFTIESLTMIIEYGTLES